MWRAVVLSGLLAQLIHAGSARASSVIVPDDFGTIQAALDYSVADTVLIRGENYPELLNITRPVTLRAMNDGSGAAPTIAGAVIDPPRNEFGLSLFVLDGLRFLGTVIVDNDEDYCELTFVACVFESGIVDYSGPISTGQIIVNRCTLFGLSTLQVRGDCIIDSCRVYGGINVGGVDAAVRVSRSLFEGHPSGGVAGSGVALIEVVGCTFRRSGGAGGKANDWIRVRDNLFEDSGRIYVDSPNSLVEGNVLSGSVGIQGEYSFTIRANRIERAPEAGIRVYTSDQGIIDGNVVVGCGVGISVDTNDRYDVRISNNTVCFNRGAGVSTQLIHEDEAASAVLHNNVIYGNGGVGIECTASGFTTMRCNNLGMNALGDGGDCGDGSQNVHVAPGFCDTAQGDFHLRDDSPMLAVGDCGLIGALGPGCDVTTPTTVIQFTAERRESGVELQWQLSESGESLNVWGERASSELGPWSRVSGIRGGSGGRVTVLDDDARTDGTYWYRLMTEVEGGLASLAGPIRVSGTERAERALTVQPNPVLDRMTLEFGLAEAGEVWVELFDTQGRRVASIAKETRSAGRQRVSWSRGSTALSPGVYLVRVRRGDREEFARIVLTR